MRLRVVALSTVTSVAAKAISVSTSLLVIPLVLAHLGSERFGLWMTIASLPAFLVFMDFGIGNGVLNSVATANGRSDREAIRRTLANGVALLSLVSVAAAIAFAALWPWLDWGVLLGMKAAPSMAAEARMSVLALGLVFFFSIPAAIAQRAFLGLQKGFVGGLWQIVASLLSFAGVLLVLQVGGAVPGMVLAMFGIPALVAIASALHLVSRSPDLIPRRGDVDQAAMKGMAATGSAFFFMQAGIAIAFASDQLVISHQLGLEKVGQFSIYQKLFSPLSLMLGFVLMPLWAAYADALARGDVKWIRRVLGKSVLVAGIGGLALAVPTALFSGVLITFWLGQAIAPDLALALCLAVWLVFESIGRCISIFLNGVGVLRQQLVITAAFVPLCIALKIWLAARLGLYGVPLAVCIAYALTHVPGYTWILRDWFARNRTVGTSP